ncbi:MAG: HAMP domain-containing sensor histidine kinase [Bacilli bacterium]
MTIKKRLSQSNLFMILIPVLVSLFVGLICLGTGYLVVTRNSSVGFDRENFITSKQVIVEAVNEELEKDNLDGLDSALSFLDKDQLRVEIADKDSIVYEYGTASDSDSYLLGLTTGDSLFVSNETRQLYTYTYNSAYKVHIFCSVAPVSNHFLKMVIVLIFLVLLITVVLSVFFTDRFLMKFVFRQINRPLDELQKGVREISNGNLDYEIPYTEDNEFKPIIEEFNSMRQELKDSIGRLKEKDADRDLLIAGVSHDIKSPLTSIRGYTEALLDGITPNPLITKKYEKIILAKCLEIDKLVSQMISYTKESSPIDRKDQILLLPFVEDYLHQNQAEFQKAGFQVVFSVKEDFLVPFTSEEMDRIFSNITSNSIKYKKGDKGTLSITSEERNGVSLLTFSDDGKGVEEKDIGKIFDPFYRSDEARSHPENGSGLGLAIIKRIVLNAQGEIRAERNSRNGLDIIISWKKENKNGSDSDCGR